MPALGPTTVGRFLREIHRWPDYKLKQDSRLHSMAVAARRAKWFQPRNYDLGRGDHSRVSVAARTPPQRADVFPANAGLYGLEILLKANASLGSLT